MKHNWEKLNYDYLKKIIGINGDYLLDKWFDRSESYKNNHTKDLISLINKHFNKDNINILDYGSGAGLDLINLSEINANLHGFEIDCDLIEISKKRLHELKINATIVNCSKKGIIDKYRNYFDLINSADVLEHVIDHKEYIGNCSKLLKIDGLLLINTPNPLSINNIFSDPHYDLFGVTLLPKYVADYYICNIRKVMKENEVIKWIYNQPSLNRYLADYGFQILQDSYSIMRENVGKRINKLKIIFAVSVFVQLRYNSFFCIAKKME